MRGSPNSRERKSGAGAHMRFARAPDRRSPSSSDSPSPCAILSHRLPAMLRRVSPRAEADARSRRQPVGGCRVGCPFPRPSRGDARKGGGPSLGRRVRGVPRPWPHPAAPCRRHARPVCPTTPRLPTCGAPGRRLASPARACTPSSKRCAGRCTTRRPRPGRSPPARRRRPACGAPP